MAIYVNTTPPVTRPSLLLDFANSKTVDRRITFTRSSSATYYDSQGILRYAVTDQPRIDHDPSTGECRGLLIEEQRTNLYTYSEDFSNSAWSKTGTTVTSNTTIAPDGTSTADTIAIGTGISALVQTKSGLTAGARHEVSFYIKKITSTGEIIVRNTEDGSYGRWSINLSLLGSGWERITRTHPAITIVAEFVASPSGILGAALYGNSSGISFYLWGAQLEVGSFATSYIPSTTTFTSRASSATYVDSSGILKIADINQPRYGYGYDSVSGKWISQGLILESAVTNLHTNGTTFSNWSRQGNVTLTPNSAIGPDGRLSAATVTTVSSTFLGFYDVGIGGGTSYLANTAYTASIFVKAGSGVTQIYGGLTNQFEGASAYYTFNLSSKAITSGSSGGFTAAGATLTELANGWFRISVTGITGASGFNSTTSIGAFWRNAEIGTAYYYGAQYEVGSSPTSYIPTFGSAVTRAADSSSSSATTRAADSASIIGSNFLSWWKATEHSFYAEALQFSPTAYGRLLDVSNGSSQKYSMYRQSGIGTNGINNQFEITGDSWSTNVYAKFAAAISSAGMSSSFNGNIRTASATFTPYQADRLNIGGQTDGFGIWNGYIKKISYYSRRLSNTELQGLTK
jgi:hypothetical protein